MEAYTSGWISGNCPMCSKRGHNPDKRGRGGIRFEDDHFQYNCFNCGFKTGWSDGRRIGGKLQELLTTFEQTLDIQRVNLELLREEEAGDIAGQYIEKPKRTKNTNRLVHCTTPQTVIELENIPIDDLDKKQLEQLALACTYTMKRGMDMNIGIGQPHMHFANRIILPFYYKGNIVGYTARWCPNTDDAMPQVLQQHAQELCIQFGCTKNT